MLGTFNTIILLQGFFFFLIGKLFFRYFYYKPSYNDYNYILVALI